MNNHIGEVWRSERGEEQPSSLIVTNDPIEIVDLNNIVKECISDFGNEFLQLKAIFRYDLLPCIPSSKDKIVTLFSNIINSIIQHPPISTKLLVYVRSQLQPEIMDLSLPEGFENFSITVYTNITANDQWRNKNEGLIAQCASIVKGIGGQLTCYNIATTGCLYTLQVPGKIDK
ncbi:MAG: hypothetical protein ABI861_14090 [Panacibacter sp.]